MNDFPAENYSRPIEGPDDAGEAAELSFSDEGNDTGIETLDTSDIYGDPDYCGPESDYAYPDVDTVAAEIQEQAPRAFAAYKQTLDALTASGQEEITTGAYPGGSSEGIVVTDELFADLFAAQDNLWRDTGVYDYVADQKADGVNHTVVITPNVVARPQQIVDAARSFKDKIPDGVSAVSPDITQYYNGRELSGPIGDSPLQFSLMPDQDDKQLSGKPLEEQVAILAERQAQNPGLGLHVPSVLEAVAHWNCVEAAREEAGTGPQQEREIATITHFDLQTKETDWRAVVLRSGMRHNGPRLSMVYTADDRDEHRTVRIALG